MGGEQIRYGFINYIRVKILLWVWDKAFGKFWAGEWYDPIDYASSIVRYKFPPHICSSRIISRICFTINGICISGRVSSDSAYNRWCLKFCDMKCALKGYSATVWENSLWGRGRSKLSAWRQCRGLRKMPHSDVSQGNGEGWAMRGSQVQDIGRWSQLVQRLNIKFKAKRTVKDHFGVFLPQQIGKWWY